MWYNSTIEKMMIQPPMKSWYSVIIWQCITHKCVLPIWADDAYKIKGKISKIRKKSKDPWVIAEMQIA